MEATKFEFEKRFWIISTIFAIGFCLGNFQHGNFANLLRHWLAPALAPGSAEALNVLRGIIAAGAVLVFIAAALRTWGVAYLRTEIVHDTVQYSDALVANGPFRYVRNPLYLANLPMAAGIGILTSPIGWLFIVAGNWFFVYRLIFREEEALRQNQGESYRNYLKAVPRFWPALKPRVPAGNRAPQWRQAFVGETFVWLFGIAELVLAISLNVRLAVSIFLVGFVAHYFFARGASGNRA